MKNVDPIFILSVLIGLFVLILFAELVYWLFILWLDKHDDKEPWDGFDKW